MIAPEVKGYGECDTESFDDYYARWPDQLSNFPKCVIENWVYRHWQDFENLWLDKSIELFAFTQAELNNSQIMQIGHIDKWLKTLDYWGDELFRDKMRQETWLAKYMLANGTSPAPIIVAPNTSGLEHPKGTPMHSNQLIEGHMRLAYLRGMIRHHHPTLKSSHSVWHVSLPNNSFKPNPLRGSA
ncbi:hypothetical protein [Xanthomonas translucens]|uniref:hypothetical protein n=1 Tax=Xanthomonas campestris pv. translucens TaxID=343 RepID=UPI001E377ADE|nr:hypothetical protein [Xanthomonas translucens]WLA12321.1 hypothetical protein MO327_19740 [Xanthomonas translucens]